MTTPAFTSPDEWSCTCGASGLGGKPAYDAHLGAEHAVPPRGIAPVDVDTKALRAWAIANGWPDLGTRGRLPQDAINGYTRRVVMRLCEYLKAHPDEERDQLATRRRGRLR